MNDSAVVRVAPLLRACLEVLRDAGEPIHGREALGRVADRVELTAYEKEPFDASGQPRRSSVHGPAPTLDASTIVTPSSVTLSARCVSGWSAG